MEAVGQNATLFPKSQISANFIFAQPSSFSTDRNISFKSFKSFICYTRRPENGQYYRYSNIQYVIHDAEPAELFINGPPG
jgi:hypothetical protein